MEVWPRRFQLTGFGSSGHPTSATLPRLGGALALIENQRLSSKGALMPRRSANVLLALLVLCVVPGVALGGTLDQIKKSGEIRIGYRTDAPPLSFNDSSGQAVGYSVELRKRIAAAVKDQLKPQDLKSTLVPLNSDGE